MRLGGLCGAEPLGFLAAVGTQVALVDGGHTEARLSWPDGARLAPEITVDAAREQVIELLARDATRPVSARVAAHAYLKIEKNGPKRFGGGAPPVGVYRAWVEEAVAEADHNTLAYLAAICCPAPGTLIDPAKVPEPAQLAAAEIETCGRLDRAAEPCFFDFTARNTQFIDQARLIGQLVDEGAVQRQLFEGVFEKEKGVRRMGWEPWSGRPGALTASDLTPSAPVHEWFAFRALRQLPIVPGGRGAVSTACRGRRKRGEFVWSLWTDPLTARTVRSLLNLSPAEDWTQAQREARGIRDLFSAELTKVGGYEGTFAPAAPVP